MILTKSRLELPTCVEQLDKPPLFYQPHVQRAVTKVSFTLFRFQRLKPSSTGFIVLVWMDHKAQSWCTSTLTRGAFAQIQSNIEPGVCRNIFSLSVFSDLATSRSLHLSRRFQQARPWAALPM